MALKTSTRRRVATIDLRCRCSHCEVSVTSTAEVEPMRGIVGQEDALEALRFGLKTNAPGQNIYMRGLTGTGRLDLVRHLLEQIGSPNSPAGDRCYVRNFEQPDRPLLITLPPGRGKAFQSQVDELIGFIGEQLLPQLESDAVKGRRNELERELQERMQALGAPFEKDLADNGLALVMIQVQGGSQPAILPVIEDQPAPPERLQQLLAEGKLASEEVEALGAKVNDFGQRLGKLNATLAQAREQHRRALRELIEHEARTLLDFSVRDLMAAFPHGGVGPFLDGVVNDVISNQLKALGEGADLVRLYRVNLVSAHATDEACPTILETQPTLQHLLGTIDRRVLPGGSAHSDHLMIHAGSLLRADGGFLVLEARDLLTEPGAWQVLVRTLRTGQLEIRPQDSLLFGSSAVLKPEPIPIQVKVILIGDPGLYRTLDAKDPDFPHLFKVLADFDGSLPLNAEGVHYYAGLFARLVHDEDLPHFDGGAIGRLVEHGTRIAGRRDRLTSRTSRLFDLAREAAFLARADDRELVCADDVRAAVRRSKRRADLPARRFREAIADGIIRIQTQGEAVGQINGLAVTHAGPLTYGFPARITTTIGPGQRGMINIEGEASLSGAIHTKGFAILGGLVRHLMRGVHHPMAFSASIAFEQSYGGIDGDSASGAEACCLLSALTSVPLRQSIAMTGAIDQHGHIQPIGAASEKIEGFYDACRDAGFTGDQGVIIPAANQRDLVLREDVAAACDAGSFNVWAVETIQEALEIFTDCEAGEPDGHGHYPEGSLLALATKRAGDFWLMARGIEPGEEAEK
jgi:predicted ATP-dependent protease